MNHVYVVLTEQGIVGVRGDFNKAYHIAREYINKQNYLEYNIRPRGNPHQENGSYVCNYWESKGGYSHISIECWMVDT